MEDGKVIIKRESNCGGYEETNRRQETEEIKLLVSGVLHREGRTFVRVSFLRGKAWAEGIVPDGVIEKAAGFTQEELDGFAAYLADEKEEIIRQAKGINPIRNLFGI